MPAGLGQLGSFGSAQFNHLPVNPQPHKSLPLGLLDHVTELPGLSHDQRSQHHEFGTLGPGQNRIRNLLRRLTHHRLPGHRIVRTSHGGKKQPQVIINLRRGRDGRTRIGPGSPLLDGNGGRQSFDVIHIRLLHLIEKLPGIGRQTLHIFALPLGIEGVKRQRGFPRSAQSRNHHQLVAGDLDIKILQVVLSRPLDAND